VKLYFTIETSRVDIRLDSQIVLGQRVADHLVRLDTAARGAEPSQ